MTGKATKKPKKAITVLRRRKVLHVGIDLARAPWSGTLVRALPANVENHGTHADDATASVLQLHRPKFPPITPRTGPGPMNRMARVMRGYELVVTHGDYAFPAVMGHTLFGQALKLPPLVHYHDGVGEVGKGWWSRFRHKLGMARTPVVIVPTQAAARSVTGQWDVPGSRVHILPPLFPPAPKAPPKADAIPRLMKRGSEKWIAVRAGDAVSLSSQLVDLMEALEEDWHLVVFGPEGETAALRDAFDAAGQLHRLHMTARLHGPAPVAGLFDLAIIDARDGLVPPDMPALMAAGVPFVAIGPDGLGELLPAENRKLLVDPADPSAVAERAAGLAGDADMLEQAGQANAALAAKWADPVPHLAILAGALGLASLEDR
ncbi:glycosyltransferase [Croceicoccus bisphenolivorans]|uniref:glycosyltransferase n=1 Tax=Croceicoccus bisphenolivorans TaxID=1783232 RepID=UPI00082D98A5|nr:glycosyltransferase [Croceicoccus bisphenolivorans]